MNENSEIITVDLNKPLGAEALARLSALDSRPIDYSDIPPLSDEWLQELAHRPRPMNKKTVNIRVLEDICTA